MKEEKEGCIFCKIVGKEIPVEFIYESDNFVVFPDKNPHTEGDCLIVAKKHYANIMDLPADLGNELVDVIKRVAEMRLKEGAEGFNLIMNNFPAAGQEIMHAHVHLIPRRKGEKVKFPI